MQMSVRITCALPSYAILTTTIIQYDAKLMTIIYPNCGNPITKVRKKNMSEVTYFHDIQVGQRFPLTIKRLGINGEGIGYYKRTIAFVTGALPEEVIVAEVTAIAPKFVNAKIHTIRQKSAQRVEPRDADYYGHVGGIELEHLSYPGQLAFKVDVIRQSLEKFKPRGYQDCDLRPTIGMADPHGYRNKAQFQVREIDGHVAAGLYHEHSHQLVDLKVESIKIDRNH